jgi:hypothetical protein
MNTSIPVIKIKFGQLANGRKSIIQIAPVILKKSISASAPKQKGGRCGQGGRLIKYIEVVEDNIYERTIFIKKKESFHKKMMTKLNKKIYTKPSGRGVTTVLHGIKH